MSTLWKDRWEKSLFKEKTVKAVLRIMLLMFVFGFAYVALVQPQSAPQAAVVTPKAPYDSVRVQLSVTRQENLQLKANAAQAAVQQEMKDFQAQWQTEESFITAWVAQVRKENGWDETYVYDRAKDSWTHEVKQPAESKPEPKK
jgi:hypothetical protein